MAIDEDSEEIRIWREIEDWENAGGDVTDYDELSADELSELEKSLFTTREELPQEAEIYREFGPDEYDNPYQECLSYAEGIGAGLEYFCIVENGGVFELYDIRG